MTPPLPPDMIRKLLGGYATGTLTAEEQTALFAAAIEDQELFDALAREQALRDHLRDPAARTELLSALDPPALGAVGSFWQWLRRPLVGGLVTAGIAVIAIVAVWQSMHVPMTRQAPAAIVAEALPPQPSPVTPLGVREQANQLATQEGRRDFAPSSPAATVRQKAAQSRFPAAGLPVVALNSPAPPPAPAARPPVFPEKLLSDKKDAAQDKAKAQDKVMEQETVARVEVTAGNQALPRANGFAAGGGGARAVLALPLRCTILRESGEVDPSTPLNAGETIRLRIVAPADGTVRVMEAGHILASGKVQRLQPFDTPPIPFTGTGSRTLSVTFAAAPAAPIIVPITLSYRP